MNEVDKTYTYRPFVKKLYWALLMILVLSELIVIRVNIFEIMQEDWVGAIAKIIVISTVVFSIFIRVWIFIRPRVHSIYKLHKTGLDIQFKKKLKHFEFSQIRKFRLTKLPARFAGGFEIELTTGQKFMISSLLTGCFEIFDRIYSERKDLVNEKDYEKLSNELKWLPLSWMRLQRKVQNWKVWGLKLIVLPLALSFWLNTIFTDLKFTSAFIICFSICLIYHVVLHLIEHSIFIKIAERNELQSIDEKLEKKMLYGFSLVYFLLSLLSLYSLSRLDQFFTA